MRMNFIDVAGFLVSRTGVDDKKAVDVSVASPEIIEAGEINGRIGGKDSVVGQALSVLRV